MKRLSWLGLVLAAALVLPTATIGARVQTTRLSTVASYPAASAAKASASSVITAAVREAAERVTAARLKEDLYYISSDAMAGRATPSPGLDATAKFIADRIKTAKLKPAGDDGTYFQRIELRSTKVDASQTSAEMNGKIFKYGDDLLVAPTPGSASGQLVYIGHGWVIKSKDIDAYQGVDVRNKIVIISAAAAPPNVAANEIGKVIQDAESPVSAAQKRGAKGVIMIPRYSDLAQWWAGRRRVLERDRFGVARFQDRDAGDTPSTLPTIMPSEAMLEQLFAGEQQTGAELRRHTVAGTTGPAFELVATKSLSFKVSVANTTATTQNVVAVLEGKDRELKKEYVAIGAHYDHVGTGRPINGDAIYNGADDDGSGTVAVLSLAEAFARGPRPKRSILFVWHAAEERGLWGSEYFTDYPTVPLNQIVAQLNIDMIGRSKKEGDANPKNRNLTGPDEIFVIGSKLMSTELGSLSERVNQSYLNLKLNYFYDNPNDSERLFYRSDHYNYARKGIPIIFYFDGIHEDYHQPSDTADKIDYQKMEKVARTVFVTAHELSDAAKRPTVDKPLQMPER
ncbi:MAG: M28 family peptidase [Acidobacteriota bacterium]|nr:M28 family peptidase [Acidobacteriota bacterium]